MEPISPAPPARTSLQRLFLAGLLTLLPIWLTWVVVKFVFGMLSDISRPWIEPILHNLAMGDPVNLDWIDTSWARGLLAMTGTVLAILLVGLLARRVVGQQLLRWFEALILRIPLASTVYSSARKLL